MDKKILSDYFSEKTLSHLKLQQGLAERHQQRALDVTLACKLVLRKYRTCIFVNGCFWHGHNVTITNNQYPITESSDCCKIPKTNKEFWAAKIRRNQQRDIEEQRTLAKMGWHCITIWECELKPKVRELTLKSLAFTLNKIWLDDHAVKKRYPHLDDEGMLIAAEDLI